MRALALAAIALAACESPSDGERVLVLERQIAKLEAELAGLRGRVEKSEAAVKRTLGEQLGDAIERLRWAGITDDEGRAIIRWWCHDSAAGPGTGTCFRSGSECAGGSPAGCRSRRIAWCPADGTCTGSPATCAPIETCRGVE
jgi:hypothetical protein